MPAKSEPATRVLAIDTLRGNGFGLSLFGQLQRFQIVLVVIAVWTVQIIFSYLMVVLFSLRSLRMGVAITDLWRISTVDETTQIPAP